VTGAPHPGSAILPEMGRQTSIGERTAATPATGALAAECQGVHKRFRQTLALQGVTLEVPRGSVFGFLGPNGAGKSTLVKILTGLVHPDTGVVRVLGGRPGSRAPQRGIGYLPEHFRFPGWLTGPELLSFHGRLLGVSPDTDHLLALVGLAEAKDKRVSELSKGMQQRLGLAQALVGRPELVFLDEPTSALDPLGRIEVRDVLLHLKERGTTVFLNSHLLTEVEKICDRVAVIDRGAIVAQGSMDELLQGPVARVAVGELSGERAGAAAAALATAPAAGTVHPIYADGEFTVPVASRDDLPGVVATLVGLGIPVYEVGLVRRSLEDAFVQLVRDHEVRDPGPDGRRP
jgi:ABC-2 type transport system ATP-binding protein